MELPKPQKNDLCLKIFRLRWSIDVGEPCSLLLESIYDLRDSLPDLATTKRYSKKVQVQEKSTYHATPGAVIDHKVGTKSRNTACGSKNITATVAVGYHADIAQIGLA